MTLSINSNPPGGIPLLGPAAPASTLSEVPTVALSVLTSFPPVLCSLVQDYYLDTSSPLFRLFQLPPSSTPAPDAIREAVLSVTEENYKDYWGADCREIIIDFKYKEIDEASKAVAIFSIPTTKINFIANFCFQSEQNLTETAIPDTDKQYILMKSLNGRKPSKEASMCKATLDALAITKSATPTGLYKFSARQILEPKAASAHLA